MEDRKKALLSAIFEEHLQSDGRAVASRAIVDKYDFSVSPATIRNEMNNLEKEGLIYQPHTSAGRVPTEAGWRYYIDNFLTEAPLSEGTKQGLAGVMAEQGPTYEVTVKRLAKKLAELSRDAIFVAIDRDTYYYTGLSNLFRQPEFQRVDLLCHMSEVVDHLDDVLDSLFDGETDGVQIMVGSENPFGKECSSLVSTYRYGHDKRGIFGILGPLRMRYADNLALLNYSVKLLMNR